MMSGRFRATAVVVALAAIALVVYRNNHHGYRNSVVGGPPSVLVAQRRIQRGTTGDAIRASTGFVRINAIPLSQIETGALTEMSTIVGEVAVKDIPAGQPLTAADFEPLGKRRVLFPKTTP